MKELQKMYELQRKFQSNFYSLGKMKEQEKTEWTKEFILSLHREVSELLNEFDWKKHRRSTKKVDSELVKEEIIDILKFLLNICIIWNFKPANIVQKFYEKSKIVEKRYQKEFNSK